MAIVNSGDEMAMGVAMKKLTAFSLVAFLMLGFSLSANAERGENLAQAQRVAFLIVQKTVSLSAMTGVLAVPKSTANRLCFKLSTFAIVSVKNDWQHAGVFY